MARVEADLARACEICEQEGGRREHSVALGRLGHVALDLGDPERARTLFAKSVAVAREGRRSDAARARFPRRAILSW